MRGLTKLVASVYLMSLGCIASGDARDAEPPRFQILSEQVQNKVASPWILQSVLCWRAVALTANISWVLASGTLLGAIRNKNVIPWDGDADVMIAGTAEWARVYPLYFRNVSYLASIAKVTPECQLSQVKQTRGALGIALPKATGMTIITTDNIPNSAYVAARVVWTYEPWRQVDITAPYLGHYADLTPDLSATFDKFGFGWNFEDTRCVAGCPWYIKGCANSARPKDRTPKTDTFSKKCAAFIDHFMGKPVLCFLGGRAFMCPEKSKAFLIGDYGQNYMTPMYNQYVAGKWRKSGFSSFDGDSSTASSGNTRLRVLSHISQGADQLENTVASSAMANAEAAINAANQLEESSGF